MNAAKAVVHGGTGTNTVSISAAKAMVVLQQGGTDNINGFNLHNGGVLDLRQVLAEVGKTTQLAGLHGTVIDQRLQGHARSDPNECSERTTTVKDGLPT